MKNSIKKIMVAAAFVVISAAAMAQGGLSPFVGSTHVYTVTAEDDVNNTLAWTVSGGTAGTDYTINSGAATEQVEITWLTAGTYTVSFTETAAGSGCITSKQVTVNVGANTFDVSTASPADMCNAADGQVNYSLTTATTGVTFTVNMATGNASFNPDWKFTFTLTSASGATLTNVKVGGTPVTPSSGTYTSPDQTSASGAGSVTVTVDAEGGINAVQDVVLTITSATELSYDTPDVDSDDWGATQTINAIPATSDISTD